VAVQRCVVWQEGVYVQAGRTSQRPFYPVRRAPGGGIAAEPYHGNGQKVGAVCVALRLLPPAGKDGPAGSNVGW